MDAGGSGSGLVPTQPPSVLEVNRVAWFWRLFRVGQGWVLPEAGAPATVRAPASCCSSGEPQMGQLPSGGSAWLHLPDEEETGALSCCSMVCTSTEDMQGTRPSAHGQSVTPAISR